MGIFDRFRRNRQTSVLPDEVREYYDSGQRQSRGVAILLTIGALLATVLIAIALFFAGRFIYNQIWGDDNQSATQGQVNAPDDQESTSSPDQNAQSGQDQPGQSGGQSGQQNQQGGQQSTPGSQGAEDSGGSGSGAPGAQSGQGSGAPAPAAPTPSTTPALGDGSLPRTGDEGL